MKVMMSRTVYFGVAKMWIVCYCSCGHSESIPVTVLCRFDMELSND